MSISIAICELDAENALCRSLKTDMRMILLDDITGFEDVVGYDEIVELDDAKDLFEDWQSFMKRNRLSDDTDAVYLEKIKNEKDLEILRTRSKDISTGWVSVSDLDAGRLKKAISASKEENRMTAWDMLSFDEMTEKCESCPLSWDKGRGCIGSFGPDNSALPEIAEKLGCTIIASVPEGASKRRIYTPDEASKLLNEVDIIMTALPGEGKMYVKRYAGCLDRLKAVALISSKERCGFYFF